MQRRDRSELSDPQTAGAMAYLMAYCGLNDVDALGAMTALRQILRGEVVTDPLAQMLKNHEFRFLDGLTRRYDSVDGFVEV